MYKRVYALDGEPFDVPVELANNLILNEGWTQTPPLKEDKPSKKHPLFKTKDIEV